MIANIKKIQIFLNKYEVLPQQSLKVTKGCDFPQTYYPNYNLDNVLMDNFRYNVLKLLTIPFLKSDPHEDSVNSKDEESQLNMDQDQMEFQPQFRTYYY